MIAPNQWRWEVEYKKPLSNGIMERWDSAHNTESYAVAQVYAELCDRGVPPPWESAEVVGKLSSEYVETDDGRTLVWFATQVAPALARLRRNGRESDALTALGISCAEFHGSV